MANKLQEYSVAHPEHDTDKLVDTAKEIMEKYDVSLKQKAINALDEAILRGDNFADSEARNIIREALETL